MRNTWIIGDIHGEYDKFLSLLGQVNFDYNDDRIISLGDLTDRGSKNWEVVEEFTKIKNKIMIKGNHDVEFKKFLLDEQTDQWWTWHGGIDTVKSYDDMKFKNKEAHIALMMAQVPYFIENNICFVHGGFDKNKLIKNQGEDVLVWDRYLMERSMSTNKKQKLKTVDNFDKIFLGHTPTTYWNITTPIQKGGIINLDTGSGKGGLLTIWNLETNEYIQA